MNSPNKHIEQDKHLNDPNNDETILTHIRKNKKNHFIKNFKTLHFLGIFDFLKLKQPI